MEHQGKYISKNSKPISLRNNYGDKFHVMNRDTVAKELNTIYFYNCDRSHTNHDHKCSKEETPEAYLTDRHAHSRYCEHQQDRRVKLCKYIMDEHYPPCQSPTYYYYEEDYGETQPARPRYMDYYLKYLDEQKKPTTCEYAYVPDPNEKYSTNEEKSTYLDTNQSPPCKNVISPRPIVAKSRYMDYLKNPNQQHNDGLKPARKVSRLDWKNYHRLDTIHMFLDDMQCDYPSLCTTGVIGSSVENRELKVLKVSNSNFGNANVWIDAGIHAREWIAPAVNTYIADYIVRNFDELPNSMVNKDWYFLPVMNPDGYEYSHTNYRMWRKNKAWHGHECIGVDLNRNFSYGWGGKGSSEDPKSPFYRGPHPFSEPESRAVRDMLKSSGIDFKIYITLHSFGQVILFPFAYRDELCVDYIRLLEGATAMSKAIYNTSGNTYKVGISRDVMYGAAGTSSDWSYGEAKIPFCYLLELTSKKHRFRLPEIEIEETGKEILSAVIALMEFVDNCDTEISVNIADSTTTEVKVAPPLSQVWAIKIANEGQRCFLRSLDTFGAINIWKEERSTMDFFVEGGRVMQVAAMLNERDIPYCASVKDVDALKKQEQGSAITIHVNDFISCGGTDLPDQSHPTDKPSIDGVRPRSSRPCHCMNWTSYHSLHTIYGWMDKLAASHPYLCSVSVIGKSSEGRDIKLLKISNGNPDNTAVWLDSAIHAREWISVAVVTYIANELVHTFHRQAESVTNKDWYILPVMNPDGYVYTHTDDRMWRKNRTKYGACVGVDLNRNFSYGWGEAGEDGSSDDPGSIFFRGPKPFSEPETAAVRKAILEADTDFKVFLSLHSYGEVIIFPWGYTGDPCPTYVELLEGGTAMARAMYATNGRTYRVGSTKDLMYFSSGTSVDWSYAVANIPYCYMVELPSKQHRFLLPKEQIISIATEVFNGVTEFMDFVDKRCKGTGPSRTSLQSKL